MGIAQAGLSHCACKWFVRENQAGFCRADITVSLVELAPTIFGGTDELIAYLRARHLLAQTKTCSRQVKVVIGNITIVLVIYQVCSCDA